MLYACWNQSIATVSGGPISSCYQFANAKFKWGANDEEGSEHTIDNIRYAMEIQSVHVKPKYQNCSLQAAVQANAVVIISYLFKVTPLDNPYLENIISGLKEIQCPLAQVEIEPVPLSWITPPFVSKYFTYIGSLTHPPCTEGVLWIIQSEPLGISIKQVSL